MEGDKINIRITKEKVLTPGKENLTKPMEIVEELKIQDTFSNI
jgi:hypothetical protein